MLITNTLDPILHIIKLRIKFEFINIKLSTIRLLGDLKNQYRFI